jgi:4-amino-4-deoxy-L-arabinose transferase-like glycosyltransferase
VTLTALGIRIAFILIAGNSEHPEMYEHGAIAHNLYTGHGFAMHWPYESLDPARVALMKEPPQYEGAFLPPLNPYFIYGAYLIFGEHASAIIFLMIFYALVSSLIPVVVHKTGVLIKGEKTGRVSAIVAVLFLPGAFAVTSFSGSPLYQLLGVIILYLAILATRKPELKYFAWLGLSCGIMTMLRSEFFFLGFLLIALSIYFARKKSVGGHIYWQGAISLMLCVVIIAPWTYRNYKLFHTFIPVLSHPWYEIWRGNNIHANGTTRNAEGKSIWISPQVYPDIVRRMDSIPYDQYFEAKVDGVFKDEVIHFIEENPGRFLVLGVMKIAYLFTIDLNHPQSRNPFYFAPMIILSALTLIGLYKLISHPGANYSAAAIFSVFFLAYLALTMMTVMLPRYQIYVFSAMMGVTGLAFRREEESHGG